MLTIGICSGKGGTAKTTTATGLAWSLKEAGLKVLLIDVDPQGHSTACMRVDRESLGMTTGDVLLRRASLEDAVITTDWGIDLCPTNERAGDVGADLDKEYYSQERLFEALLVAEDCYDIAILDCPPSLKQLTANAIFAADWILAPSELSYLSYERTIDLRNEAERVCAKKGAPTISTLIVRFDSREKVLNDVILKAIKEDDVQLMKTKIPVCTKIKQAQSAGMSVQAFAPRSSAAKAFNQLAKEIQSVLKGESHVAAA